MSITKLFLIYVYAASVTALPVRLYRNMKIITKTGRQDHHIELLSTDKKFIFKRIDSGKEYFKQIALQLDIGLDRSMPTSRVENQDILQKYSLPTEKVLNLRYALGRKSVCPLRYIKVSGVCFPCEELEIQNPDICKKKTGKKQK